MTPSHAALVREPIGRPPATRNPIFVPGLSLIPVAVRLTSGCIRVLHNIALYFCHPPVVAGASAIQRRTRLREPCRLKRAIATT